MSNDILFYIFIVIGTINFLHLGLYLIGGNIYDIREFKRQKTLALIKKKRYISPLISIIVPAHNESLVIERCMESIRKSGYRKYEVIVHNDRSTDATRQILEVYKKAHPRFNLRVINRRTNVGKGAGVNFAIKRYAKGSLIMTLDADCMLHKDAIKNTIRYFRDSKVVGVAANVQIMDSPSILAMLQKFEHLVGYRSKKFYTLTNSEFIIGGVASTYRAETLKAVKYYDTDTQTEDIGLSMKVVARSEREQRIVYAADVLAMTEGVQSLKALLKQRYRWKLGMMQNIVKHIYLFGNLNKRYSKMLTLYRIPMAVLGEIMLLLQPVVLAYIFYLSIHFQTTTLFFGAYLTITAYILLSLWPDEHIRLKRKITMSAYSPVMYFVFYIMDIVQIIAIIRVISQPKKILRKGNTTGSWVSPERSGMPASF